MKSSLARLLTTSLLAMAIGTTAQAAPITGNFGIGGGEVTLNTTDVNTATAVTAWTSTILDPITFSAPVGTLSSANNQTVTFSGAWNFNSGPIANFFTVGTFDFDLVSSSISSQGGGFLNVTGFGTMNSSVAGEDSTAYMFRFSTQNPEIAGGTQRFTFSVTGNPTGVPEGGSTLLLLSSGLIAMGLVARFRRRI